ncbi:uncharacterized protein EAF02_004853 [Botrytis sinoallii]|uniref:uncharacterized protein n=1 Tax=Botrytis sinoallii TaxID=1463999 RepID=UPI001901728B|nr:uncharacterized protein EAF02_004853 [Botrytis sinoallii]KAF7884517.1 hypothetical protein EAF02_004853 [Botrytis sinoallii]
MSAEEALFNLTNIPSALNPSAAGDISIGYYHALSIGQKESNCTSAISGLDFEAHPLLWVIEQAFFQRKCLYHDLENGVMSFAVLDGEESNSMLWILHMPIYGSKQPYIHAD